MTSVWLSVDPLAEDYPGWSPYNYTLNNPINLIDPDGRSVTDDYYDQFGEYLGSDGSSSNNARIIDRETFEFIDQGFGADSKEGTELLQGSSRIIKVDNKQIQRDLQTARDKAIETGNEYSVEIILNPVKALITSRLGEIGNNKETDIVYTKDSEGTFEETGYFPLLAQAHSHPKNQTAGEYNIWGTSQKDENAANNIGIPIYSIDSYSGKVGTSGRIHRVSPDRTHTNNLGFTIGNSTKNGAGQFNIGIDALRFRKK